VAASVSGGAGPSEAQVRAAVDGHVSAWNDQDRDRWVALWADDVTFDDPVGAPTKHGRAAVEKSWDSSQRPGRRWILDPQQVIIGGDEAAVVMHNHGDVDGKKVLVRGIEIYKVRPDGLIGAVRAYFEQPTEVELDPYYHQTRQPDN